MSTERRNAIRVPDNRLITEIASNRPSAASVINISCTGLFTMKPTMSSGLRDSRIIQIEIPLPEASESIWAKGQVVFMTHDHNTVGTGIRILDMADLHYRLLDDLVETRREKALAEMERQLRWRKELCAHPSPYSVPPPAGRTENTVKIYMIR